MYGAYSRILLGKTLLFVEHMWVSLRFLPLWICPGRALVSYGIFWGSYIGQCIANYRRSTLIIMCIFCDQYSVRSSYFVLNHYYTYQIRSTYRVYSLLHNRFTLVALNQPTMTPLHDSLPTYSDSPSSCEGPAAPALSLHGCDNRLRKRSAFAARVFPPRCSPT